MRTALGLVLASVAAAQTPQLTARLEGHVVTLAGEQIPRATVTLARGITSVADDQGKFVFEDVTPGRYTLTAERSGFLTKSYDSPLTVKSGDDLKDLVFKLTPQAIITGRVTDQDGDPVPGRQVSAYQYVYFADSRTLRSTGSARTDDQGNFRIANLAPGRYFLGAESNRSTLMANCRSAVGACPGRPETEIDLRIFYPNEADYSRATPIEIGAGAELRGMDIKLRRVRVYSIRGKVMVAATGDPLKDQVLSLISNDAGSYGASSRTDDNGVFEFQYVPPGSYTIERNPQNNQPGAPIASFSTTATITNRDLESVTVVATMIPAVDITGVVVAEGSDVPLRGLVQLSSTGASAQSSISNGAIEIRGLAPLKYTMNIAGAPPGLHLKSIRFGKQDALLNPLDLTGGSGGAVQIVLSARGAEISGTVKNAQDEPVRGVVVSLWPKTPRLGLGPGGSTYYSTTDQGGNFQIVNVPADEYYMAGWEEGDADLVRYATFAARFNSEASQVKVQEGAKVTVEVKLIPRERIAAVEEKLPTR